jgi:hypothetical protein
MFTVERLQRLLYCFHIYALVKVVLNFLRVNNDMMKLRSTSFFPRWRVFTYFFSSSLIELELYGRCYLCHPSCHHLQSEQVEAEGTDMSEVEGMNMVEEQDHPMNHQLGEEDMNMVGSHMVEAGMDTVEEPEHPMNHRPKVDGIYREDNAMMEDMMIEVNVVKR